MLSQVKGCALIDKTEPASIPLIGLDLSDAHSLAILAFLRYWKAIPLTKISVLIELLPTTMD